MDACNLLPQCIHFRFQTLCAFSFFFFFLHFALFDKLSSTRLCSIYRSFQKRKRKLQHSEIQQETSTFLPFFSCFYALIQLHYIRNIVSMFYIIFFYLTAEPQRGKYLILWSCILSYSTTISREFFLLFYGVNDWNTIPKNLVKVPEEINLNATSKRVYL